jgi:hypothetical protein
VDLAAVPTIQRKHREENTTDLTGDRCRLIEDRLIVRVRFALFVTVRWKTSFWFARDGNTRVQGFDQKSSARLSRLYCEARQ